MQVLTGMRGFDAWNQLLGDVSQPCEVRTTSFIMTFGPFETHMMTHNDEKTPYLDVTKEENICVCPSTDEDGGCSDACR